jgi:hypothetical protein
MKLKLILIMKFILMFLLLSVVAEGVPGHTGIRFGNKEDRQLGKPVSTAQPFLPVDECSQRSFDSLYPMIFAAMTHSSGLNATGPLFLWKSIRFLSRPGGADVPCTSGQQWQSKRNLC